MMQFQCQNSNGTLIQHKFLGCLLPENYVLPTTIHPLLAMWQQQHHGASFKDGILLAVGPQKNILQSNCPKKYRQRFLLMKKFCKTLLDNSSGESGNESITELGVVYKSKSANW